MNKYIVECFRGVSSLQTSKNFTSDNECSQLLLSIIFLGTQTLKVGHASYLILPTPMCSPQAHACYLLNTHTTHPPTPPIPPTTQNTHSETDTNPQRQPKHKPTLRTDGHRQTPHFPTHPPCTDTPHTHHHNTHTIQQNTQHNNTTTRQCVDRQEGDREETETETETETDKIRQTEHNRTERNVFASVCV